MTIESKHVSDFKIRIRLLLLGAFIGVAICGALGNWWTTRVMTTNEGKYWPLFIEGKLRTLVGLERSRLGMGDVVPAVKWLNLLSIHDDGYWRIRYEQHFRIVFLYCPVAGAFIGIALVAAIGKQIGR